MRMVGLLALLAALSVTVYGQTCSFNTTTWQVINGCPQGFKCQNSTQVGAVGLGGFFNLTGSQGVCIQCGTAETCPSGVKTKYGSACSVQATVTVNCDGGFVCSTAAAASTIGYNLKGDNVTVDGNCMTCQLGQYCPAATIDQFYLSQPILCPAGFYCPSTTQKIGCPQGYYCPQGLSTPLNCTTQGTFCPVNSSVPTACPKGFYCSNPGQIQTCPENNFCKQYSVAPHTCLALFRCPSGSVGPNATVPTFIAIIVIVSLILGAFFVFRKITNDAEKVESGKLQTIVSDINNLNMIIRSILGKSANSTSFRGFKERSNKVTLGFANLSLVIGKEKKVLDNVSGEFRHSRITAIMGPSGSGKSTFLNVLTGKAAAYGEMNGRVFINSNPGDIQHYKHQIGFGNMLSSFVVF
jgi:hypothetical protein